MSDIDIRVVGRAGRVTFTRAQALNAMTYEMCMAIDAAMRAWVDDDTVALIVIDAVGDKAFCAGGDIAELYATGIAGDYAYGQKFWRDEYLLNAVIAQYPKPVISFMQGFVMGGGVGIGCHASLRVVDDTTSIAMPECGIGLVPDVGGSYLLARAPGHLGEYLGMTGARMGADDAIYAGFADVFIPRTQWADAIETLESSGDVSAIDGLKSAPPKGKMRERRAEIDAIFGAETLGEMLKTLKSGSDEFLVDTLKAIKKGSPLSMACAAKIIKTLRAVEPDIRTALELEYRFTHRSMQNGDFLEGIRTQIIDKDRNPAWKHKYDDIPKGAVEQMLAPLQEDTLTF